MAERTDPVRAARPGGGPHPGVLAAGLLIVSATLTWTQGQPAVGGDATLLHALAFVAFATGGFAHVACLGVLVAGVAVPGLLARLLPAWLAWVGLVVAALSELSLLAMVLPGLAFLIPLGRFGSLAWLVAAGFLLPAARARRTVPDRSEPS